MSEQSVNPMPESADADSPAEGTLDEAVQAEIKRLNERAEVTKAPTKAPAEDKADEDNADDDNAVEEGADAEDAESEDEDGEQSPELVEAEYEGKKYKVPAELKDALLRQADYSRKTAEVAEARKSVEAYAKQASELFFAGEEFVKAKGYLSMVERQIVDTEQNTDWAALRRDDVLEFSARSAELQRLQQHRDAVAGHVERHKAVYANAAQEQTQRQIQEGQRILKEILPEWSSSVASSIGTAARVAGVRLETLQALNDGFDPHALAWIANLHAKAQKFDALQSGKAAAMEKVKAAPPVVKAGAATSQQRNSAEQMGKRLRSTGNVHDAVAYELALMSKRR
jgi:hypothetical protein